VDAAGLMSLSDRKSDKLFFQLVRNERIDSRHATMASMSSRRVLISRGMRSLGRTVIFNGSSPASNT